MSKLSEQTDEITEPPLQDSGGRGASFGRVLTDHADFSHGVALYLEKLTVSFDGFKALNDLSLAVNVGELRCIIGPNGAGKTTLMDVITGKTRPDTGSAFFGQHHDLLSMSEPQIAHLGIGRKFQKPTVFEELSSFENLELALKTDKRVWPSLTWRLNADYRDRIMQTLRLIRLGQTADSLAGNLSHGQKQWLEIGMLLMQDPILLLLDEPVAGMTDEERHRTAELLNELRGKHSLVVVEHDMAFVEAIARHVTVLHEGSVLAEGSLAQVQNNESVIDVYLGADMLLSVSGINQYYGGSHILRDASVNVDRGRITTLLGRNGVGKTTLLRSMMGVTPIRSGSINFDGQFIHQLSTEKRVALGIGYVPQGREIFMRLTVEENLRMGLASLSGRQKLPDRLFELFPVLLSMLRRRGGDLSGGQQQQLAIARALAAGPKLLLLDEPTEGIQPSIIKDIKRVIRQLADEDSIGVLLVEQYYDFARDLADEYAIMNRGAIVSSGRGSDMDADGVREMVAI